jgi:rhodanese-related sulfurtransferase
MDRLLVFIGHHPLTASDALVASLIVAAFELRLRSQGAAALSPQELIRLMNQGALLLDLRPQEQFAAGHISGARQMPSEQILKAGDSLKKYKEKLVIVYCEGGSVAPAAVRQLASQGFTKAFSLRGGLSAWRAENLPLART